ncbi:YbfB/YjiJ family MFS transporter [Williamsia phyllosphaerae]|nr:YbfB/YjiJ family MFS transporter [Williamsia phyllosphaerae]
MTEVERDGWAAGPGVALAGAAGLVASMGVGRFAFTPFLPLMEADNAITASGGAAVATANYAGYLAGAVALSIRPTINTRGHLRMWAVALVASEALMAVADGVVVLSVLRFVAGVASAVIFVGCVSTVAHARRHGASSAVTFAGVGAGIAISGVLTLVAGPHLSWQQLWIGAAIITALALAPISTMRIHPEPDSVSAGDAAILDRTHHSAWRLLLAAYFLEGLGYIVIGTFLVAAVSGNSGSATSSAGPVVWIVVGLTAVPAGVIWTRVSSRIGAHRALGVALVVQAVAALLPAVSSSTAAALVAAALFGGTFIGIVSVAMSVGAALPVARTAAILTAVYGVGQVLGPVVVTPVLGSSYTLAFVIATVVLLLAALAAFGVARTMPRRRELVGV